MVTAQNKNLSPAKSSLNVLSSKDVKKVPLPSPKSLKFSICLKIFQNYMLYIGRSLQQGPMCMRTDTQTKKTIIQTTQIYFGYFHLCQFSKKNYVLKYFQLKVISYGLQIKSFKNTV